MNYSDYIAENLDKSIEYSEYVAENLNKSINYSEYLAENLDKNLSYTEYDGNEEIRKARNEKIEKLLNDSK